MGKETFTKMFLGYKEFVEKVCVGSLNSKGYQQLLNFPKNFKFDLIIYDFTIFPQCLLGMVHKFNNPSVIGVTPFLFSGKVAKLSGSLIFPGIAPSPLSSLTRKMNFQQRVISAYEQVFEIALDYFQITPLLNELVQKRHPGIPHIDDIEKKATKIILVNTQPITDYKLPAFPNVKLVGGAQIRKPKPLPIELKNVADKAIEGLILFSLGTNVRSDTLGEERILKIVRALGRLNKYTFLWKFETAEKLPIEVPKNIIVQPWMPQNDVLAHPNTKLFISHCGLLSTQESLWYGVPVLGFPIYADQPQNAIRLKELGVGEELSIHDFSEDDLYETIKKMIEDPKYKIKGKAISSALRDQPMTPLEEATYWAEWVIRNPDINLSSPSTDINFFVRHSLDVVALIFVIATLALLLCLKIIKILIRIFSSTKKVSPDKKRN